MSLVTRNALIALGITIAIIATVVVAIDYLNRERLADLSAIEDQISIDTLSLDTQFSLLEVAPCGSVASSTNVTEELTGLGDQLSSAESQLGSGNAQVIRLKDEYSLLEIRDYLVTQELATACGTHPVTVLYFFSNAGNCSDCDRAGYALSYLRSTYPNLRVYSFDYNLDLGALQTLIGLDNVKNNLPAFIINNKPYYGFTDLATLEAQFPRGTLATSTATSTAPNLL
jgi:hypothetical protein